MNLQVIGKGVAVSPAMRDQAAKKLERIVALFEPGTALDVVVVYKVHPVEQSCEVTVRAPQIVLRAKTRGKDTYECLDLCIDKLEGQMRKVKTQLERRRDHSVVDAIKVKAMAENQHVDTSVDVRKLKKLDLVPMDADEAIARMDALGHSFFIYLDSETNLVNVIYARDDGGFGRIEIERH